MDYDFSGYVTKNDIRCTDGRTIRHNAFKQNHNKVVPLVWNHQHNSPDNVLGRVRLENRNDGVYGYAKFNDTESGQIGKELVTHGDVISMSIYANQLKQNDGNVIHGNIREVSLVLAGANSGAIIDTVLAHDDSGSEEGYISMGCDISLDTDNDSISHTDEIDDAISHSDSDIDNGQNGEKKDDMPNSEKTVQDVLDEMTPEQRAVVAFLIEQAQSTDEDTDTDPAEEADDMKHNVFDTDTDVQNNDDVISHSDVIEAIQDCKDRRYTTLKDSFIAHGIEDIEYLAHKADYGVENVDYLFPEARAMNASPSFISRNMDWVSGVMSGVSHTPFSRLKSVFADITADEARARGYIKGKLKKEEVFTLLKRTTTPTTIYKKQKMDRDDVIDITDFDVISWLKGEMRMMLDEEIARAILVGDGRMSSDDDHINEQNVRPIWTDDDLYTIKATVDTTRNADTDSRARAFIRAAVKARKDYKGSGNPVLYTTEDFLTDALLLEDPFGRSLYESVDKLATKLRVSRIVTVPVMEGLSRSVEGKPHDLMGIIVNLKDYNVGADKGGAVSMFDDFDIDYNQQKYLIETRCSGALIRPYAAIAIEGVAGEGEVAPATADLTSGK